MTPPDTLADVVAAAAEPVVAALEAVELELEPQAATSSAATAIDASAPARNLAFLKLTMTAPWSWFAIEPGCATRQ
jgi:hypothetical protein